MGIESPSSAPDPSKYAVERGFQRAKDAGMNVLKAGKNNVALKKQGVVGSAMNVGTGMVTTAIGETAKLGMNAVGYIGKKTLKALGSVLGETVKLGGNLAINTPIVGLPKGIREIKQLGPRALNARLDRHDAPPSL